MDQHELIPAKTRLRKFYVFNVVQSLPVYILADSGSARNLISLAMFKRLTYKPKLRHTGDVRIIGGNRFSGDRRLCTATAIMSIVVFWHEFGVCQFLPIDCIIGREIRSSHQCSLLYQGGDRRRIDFGVI